MDWRHVDLERSIVQVTSTATFKTKAGKRRVVPLNGKAIYYLLRDEANQYFPNNNVSQQ